MAAKKQDAGKLPSYELASYELFSRDTKAFMPVCFKVGEISVEPGDLAVTFKSQDVG